MKHQRGEIATILTLVSVGMMLMGLVVGNVAVQQTTQLKSLAANSAVCPVSCPAGNWSCVEEPYATESCCADTTKQAQYNARYTNPEDAWKWDAGAGKCGGAKGIEKTSSPPATTIDCETFGGACYLESGTGACPTTDTRYYKGDYGCGSKYPSKPNCCSSSWTGPATPPAVSTKIKENGICDSDTSGICVPASKCNHVVPDKSILCEGTLTCCDQVREGKIPENGVCDDATWGKCVPASKCNHVVPDKSILCEGTLTCCDQVRTDSDKQLGEKNHVVCSDAKTENGGKCESGKNGEKQLCYHECRPERPGYSHAVYCSGVKGYEIGTIEKDPGCGEASGPTPIPGAKCTDGSKTYVHGQVVENCVQVACDGLNWVAIDKKCLDGQIVNYPGGVLVPGNCGGTDPPKCNGKVVPTQALVNPTKSPNKNGFHIGSEIYTINRDNGVEFQFNIKFFFDGCDGDIKLEQDGNTVAGVNGWKGPGEYPYSPAWTNSPILGNGEIRNITYTGRLVNYHCLGGKNPDNLTDSIRCRLAVDELGNPRLSGTGCIWMNQNSAEAKPIVRSTITPKPAGKTGTPGSTSSTDCNPFQCPDGTGKFFSVQNHKLFLGRECKPGNEKNAYNDACDTITLGACDAVSGGADKGACRDNEKACKDLADKGGAFTGRGYDYWGPTEDNNVNIRLCQGTQVCCEPNNGPKGGFKPVPEAIIAGPTTSGVKNSGNADTDCEYSFPPTVTKGTPFAISVKTKEFNMATGVKLKIKTNPEITIDADPNVTHEKPSQWTYTTWDFKNIKIPDAGSYTLSMVFSETQRANFDDKKPVSATNQKTGTACVTQPTITVSSTSVSSGTSTLADTDACGSLIRSYKVTSKDLWTKCAQCMIDDSVKISGGKTAAENIRSATGYGNATYASCNDIQKTTAWCAGNSSLCGEAMNTATCKKVGQCQDSDSRQLIFPLSYSNEGYDAVIVGMNSGSIDARFASLYVLNATRVPGLQRLYCDPFLGQCDFYYQNPQVGT